MARKILVTPRSLTARGLDNVPELDKLREQGYELVPGPAGQLPTKENLLVLARDVVGWLAGVEKIDAEILASAPCLRVISRNGAGTDAIDATAAEAQGIKVLRAAGANARGVAELALTLILSALRNVPSANILLHGGGWERRPGREMSEIRLGLVGYGAVGRMLGDMATLLGSRVTFYDPYAPDATGEVGRAESIEQLFAASDVISLHSPPSPDGKPLVTRGLLDLLPSGSILINTARETLADSSAVLSALDSGQLAAFALDAFESEPPVLTDLFRHDRTILTPHVGAYTSNSVSRAVSYAANNLVVFLQEHEA